MWARDYIKEIYMQRREQGRLSLHGAGVKGQQRQSGGAVPVCAVLNLPCAQYRVLALRLL